VPHRAAPRRVRKALSSPRDLRASAAGPKEHGEREPEADQVPSGTAALGADSAAGTPTPAAPCRACGTSPAACQPGRAAGVGPARTAGPRAATGPATSRIVTAIRIRPAVDRQAQVAGVGHDRVRVRARGATANRFLADSARRAGLRNETRLPGRHAKVGRRYVAPCWQRCQGGGQNQKDVRGAISHLPSIRPFRGS
jgi:hypothetical protein